MKKELLSFNNLIKFILIILFLLSISFIVQYNIKEYKKENNDTTSVVKESYLFLKDINAIEIENTEEFNNQLKVKNDIVNKLNEENFTIDSPLVIINPYGINPLSALLAFNTKDEKSINVIINGEYSYLSEVSKQHILPIFYLLPNETNRITLNGIEIDLNISLETTDIDNTNNLLYVLNDKINAYKYNKQVMSLDINVDDYIIESNGNFLIKNNNKLSSITPYGFISDIYYFDEDVIDYNESEEYLYVLLNNRLIRVNKNTKEETNYDITGKYIDIYNDLIVISNNNIISFYNNNLELQYIFYENGFQEYKDKKKKKSYNTKYPINIKDVKLKDNLLYVLDDNTLRIYTINFNNKTIRTYKTFNNINSNHITYEDNISLDKNIITDLKRITNLGVESNKTYIKHPSININESTYVYYKNTSKKYETLDDNIVETFKDVDTININLVKRDNLLMVDGNMESIILLNPLGSAYEFNLNNKKYIDISLINDGKYFIYTKIDSKVYNTNRYINKRSSYE